MVTTGGKKRRKVRRSTSRTTSGIRKVRRNRKKKVSRKKSRSRSRSRKSRRKSKRSKRSKSSSSSDFSKSASTIVSNGVKYKMGDYLSSFKSKLITLYYDPGCPWSMKAYRLLRTSFPKAILRKKVRIIKLPKDKRVVKYIYRRLSPWIGSYRSRPLIFSRGKFLGGYDAFKSVIVTAQQMRVKPWRHVRVLAG